MSEATNKTAALVQAWLLEHGDCAGHEYDLCALVDSAILDARKEIYDLGYNQGYDDGFNLRGYMRREGQ